MQFHILWVMPSVFISVLCVAQNLHYVSGSLPTVLSPVPAAVWRARDEEEHTNFGMFANGSGFESGEVIERCYSQMLLTSENREVQTLLYSPPQVPEISFFPFGWCLLYNDCIGLDGEPNVAWEYESQKDAKGDSWQYVTLRARRKIIGGEELCVQRSEGSREGVQDAVKSFSDAQIPTSAHVKSPSFEDIRAMIDSKSKFDASQLAKNVLEKAKKFDDDQRFELSPSTVELRYSPLHGHGAFAEQQYEKGDIVEEAPILLLPKSISVLPHFIWNRTNYLNTAILGYGMIYNHDIDADVAVVRSASTRYVHIVALKPIAKGQEIFISYGEDWFKARGLSDPSPSLKMSWLQRVVKWLQGLWETSRGQMSNNQTEL